MNTDRNLLFGLLALQLNFINRQQLVAAFDQWLTDKSKPLAEILEGQGALLAERRTLLDALVAEHLKLHGNDPEKSLADLTPVDSVREDLQRLGDADVEASLAHVAADRGHNDLTATQTWAAGEATSAGMRFRILRPHARGGLGEVYVARDEELHREVALKEIQARHAHDSNSRSRFLLEAEITGGLEHPGIVPVYGLGTYADGRPFYAMRFIKGDSLKEAIERFHRRPASVRNGLRAVPGAGDDREPAGNALRGLPHNDDRPDGTPRSAFPADRSRVTKDAISSLEFRKLLGRFIDVCNAIEYAHSRGVLHRDLKPGNIMLGKYGETLVVDWGLAKAVGRPEAHARGDELTLKPSSGSGSAPTQMGSAVGTPEYMSPEQAEGRLDQLGPATDVYSLGATLYCLLTGRTPFAGAESAEILWKVARSDFPPPRALNAAIPRALEAVCLKAMSIRPGERYPSPRSLADDIEHWLADEAVGCYAEHVLERVYRCSRKHKEAVVSGIMVLIVLFGSTFTVIVQREHDKASAVARLADEYRRQAAEGKQMADEKEVEANRIANEAEVIRREANEAMLSEAKARQEADDAWNKAAELERELVAQRSVNAELTELVERLKRQSPN